MDFEMTSLSIRMTRRNMFGELKLMNIKVFGTDGRVAALNDSNIALQARAHASSFWCYFWFWILLTSVLSWQVVLVWDLPVMFGMAQFILIPGGILVLLYQTIDYRFSSNYGAVSAIREIRRLLGIKMEDDEFRDACNNLIRRNVVELLHRENKYYGKDSSSAKRQREKALTMYRVLRELGAVKKPFNDFFTLGD